MDMLRDVITLKPRDLSRRTVDWLRSDTLGRCDISCSFFIVGSRQHVEACTLDRCETLAVLAAHQLCTACDTVSDTKL